MKEQQEDVPGFYIEPRSKGAFPWYGFWFYVAHFDLFLLQVRCYLWRGHTMKYTGYDHAGSSPKLGEYCCEDCGVMVLLRKDPEASPKRTKKPL